MAVGEKILLGAGVVTIGTTPIGLTRGGSVFGVEREIRPIEADGDKGPVVGREVIDREVPKLTVNALELFSATDMIKYYPGLKVDSTTDPAKPTVTSTLKIETTDYNDVKWEGTTKSGKKIIITVMNATNLENIEWKFEDKNETVPQLIFTGHYTEEAPNTAPWKKEYPTT
jgi:hypothetical protein